MERATDTAVARMHDLLVEELGHRGHPLSDPVSVAELYNDIIPYGAVRSRLGFELNADYEHTLLRLLAGVEERVRLEPDEAREELARELEAPYPDVGRFRKFASSRVWVAASEPAAPEPEQRDDLEAPAAPEPPDAPEPRDAPERPEAREQTEAREQPVASEQPAATGPHEATEPSPATDAPEAEPWEPAQALDRPDPEERAVGPEPGACGFCAEPLPAGREVRFCPYCGRDQQQRPCPRCDTPLAPDWRYCIECGLEVEVHPA